MRGTVAGAVMLLMLALPSAASADVWAGKTNQKMRGVVETNPDGTIKRVLIKWRARCQEPGFLIGPTKTRWISTPENPIEQSGFAFSDSGAYPEPPDDGLEYEGQQTLSGRFLTDGRVAVKQTTEVQVKRRGRLIDTCKSTVRFTGTKR